MRLVWFEGPINRCHALLKKEKKQGKNVFSVSNLSDFDKSMVFKDVFSGSKNVAVICDEIDDLDSKISSMCKSWSEDDMVVFVNAKRTFWSKCCSMAKDHKTLVEMPCKIAKNKALSITSERLKFGDGFAWAYQMIVDSCSVSAWSKDVDLEKLEMVLETLELTFSKRKPRDKADLACSLGFHASDILAKISEAQSNGDAALFCRMLDIAERDMNNSLHAIQAISSSGAVKNSKLMLLKTLNTPDKKIMEFCKNDGNALFNQYIVSKTDSNVKLSFGFADYIATCEAGGIVPYGAWGSLAWTAVLLHKNGDLPSSILAKIISAYKSARKENKHVSDS